MGLDFPVYRGERGDTAHGEGTPHSLKTPHKYPQTETSTADVFLTLNNILYPTGRAWQDFDGNILGRLHDALNASFLRLLEDAIGTINSTFPDTELFDLEDINLWEYRLGLISNQNVDIDLRRQAVLRKVAFPNNTQPRQSRTYIQHQLQLAGFNVSVIENTFPYKTADEVLGDIPGETQHADDVYHGNNLQHGIGQFDVIANSKDLGEIFAVGGEEHLYATFFIVKFATLAPLTTTDIPTYREEEFRELVLKLKPAQTVAYVLKG